MVDAVHAKRVAVHVEHEGWGESVPSIATRPESMGALSCERADTREAVPHAPAHASTAARRAR
jgi:hypothetical protein